MENIGKRHIKAAEIYKNDLLALEVVPIIEAEANFIVCAIYYLVLLLLHTLILSSF